MSTIGHPIVGLALARRFGGGDSRRARVLIAAGLATLSLLPDIDVVLIRDERLEALLLGHRGATHSMVVAAVIALGCALIAGPLRLPKLGTAAIVFATLASHAVLDTLTMGPGIAWLWPLTDARLPVYPLLPIGSLDIGTPADLLPMLAEFIVFLPVLAYALWPRRSSAIPPSS
jgi:inner membrane protein